VIYDMAENSGWVAPFLRWRRFGAVAFDGESDYPQASQLLITAQILDSRLAQAM